MTRLVLGGPFGEEEPSASAERLAYFAERGGRLVESARSYRGGTAEEAIGLWMRKNPGALDAITKVGHGPDGRDLPLTRAAVRSDVETSLACLRVEVLDTLLLHCDDPARDVEEIAETLADLVDAGYTRRIGASNWPAPRLARLADAVARRGHVLVASYHFSLATPDPVALRSLAAGPDVLGVVEAKGLPLLSWSAQARGYFARSPGSDGSPYDTEESRARRRRCRDLAGELGAAPETVALAWTLHHPAVLASVGPRTREQLDRSFEALSLTLTGDQLRWLHGP